MSNEANQNSAEPFTIFADDSTAIGTGKTGLTITATLCKNGGGSFSAVSPTITELGGGWYRVTPIAAHRDTLGEQVWVFSAAGAIIAGRREVVNVDRLAAFFAKLFRWLGVLMGKSSDPATLAEIQATTGGATYNNVTDSLEAVGDAIGPIKDDTTAIITGIETAKDEVIAELSPLATTDQLTTAKDEILTAMDTDQTELIEAFTEQLDATKDEILLAISDDNPVGPGGIPKEITITKLGVPVDGAAVWITLDIEGTNIIAGTLYTDTFGNVTFMLEAGTYYAWVQKAEVDFVNPTEITVE